MCDALIDYFKEISPDLTPDEMKTWGALMKMKRLTSPLMEENIVRVGIQLDSLDMKIRGFAKRHGYLTKNMKNVRAAIIDM